MHEGQEPDHAFPLQVNNVIRKSLDRKPPRWDIAWHAGHDAANLGPPYDLLKRGIDGFNELDTKTGSPTVVPNRSIL